MPLDAIDFDATITLGAVIVSVLVVIVAGLPVRLIATLRTERDEWKRRAEEQARELVELRGRTDLEPILREIGRLVASVEQLAATSTARHERFAENLATNSKLLQGLVVERRESADLLRGLVTETKASADLLRELAGAFRDGRT